MRFVMVVLVGLGLMLGSTAAPVLAVSSSGEYAAGIEAQQAPPAQIDVDIDADRGGAWYTSPVWIAIGVIALVLLIVLIVMATRGGGTTIVRE